VSLASCFTGARLAEHLPSPGAWRPYPSAADRAAWARVPPAGRDYVRRQAASILAEPWPVLTAGAYARFSEDGDREAYERPYFARRNRLGAAVITSALAGPASELTSEIIDGVWLLCEETSWCLPAHEPNVPLPDPAEPYVDLFAAETASLLAWTDLLAGDLIEARAGIVRRRMRDAVRERVLRPYRERDDWQWFGLHEENLNNWTPWIHSNLLTASLLLDERREDAVVTARRATGALDRYLDSLPADGGCDEGITYWWRAGASLFECVQILAAACGAAFGAFGLPKLRATARYPLASHICGNWHVNFADASPRPVGAPWLLYRFGQAIGDDQVARHAIALRDALSAGAARLIPDFPMPGGSLGRVIPALLDAEWAAEPPRSFPMPAQSWLAQSGVLAARQREGSPAGLFLAAKAGHNDESHNHNDVGSFIVARDGRPVIIDVGVGAYTKQTFGPGRYDMWTMQSSWHNVPEAGGVPQAPGRSHAARAVTAELTAAAAALTMDLAPAYPAEAGLRSWQRTLRLDRGRGIVVIEDSWDFSHVPEGVTLHLITAAEPRHLSPGRLLIPVPAGPAPADGIVVTYPAPTLTASIEPRALDDSRQLRAAWGPFVYRVTLTATDPAPQETVSLEITDAGLRSPAGSSTQRHHQRARLSSAVEQERLGHRLARFDGLVRFPRVREGEGLADQRSDLPPGEPVDDVFHEPGTVSRPELQIADGAHLDPPAPGRVGVDGREGTTGRTVRREPSAVGHQAEGGGTGRAADAVEDDGRAGAAGRREHGAGPVRLAVVDRGECPGGSDRFQLGLSPGGTDDPRAPGRKHLDEQDPHAAGRAQDQNRLTGPDAADLEDAQRGGPVVQDRGGVEQVDLIGHGNRRFQVGQGELGVTAGPAGAAGMGGHPLAEPAPADPQADCYDLAAYPVARNVRGPDGEVVPAGARPDHRVDEQDVAGRNGDQDLFRSRRRVRQVGERKHVRRAEVAHLDGLHGDQARSARSAGSMSRVSKPG
jgi:hypothetical protein